jgi:hypothetical protein
VHSATFWAAHNRPRRAPGDRPGVRWKPALGQPTTQRTTTPTRPVPLARHDGVMTQEASHLRPDPLGTFHAITVKDAAALERDGHPYFAVNRLAGDDAWEVQFADGTWMLAHLADLNY